MSLDDRLIVEQIAERQVDKVENKPQDEPTDKPMQVRKWIRVGRLECDICLNFHYKTTDLSKQEFFVDGKTQMGPWALMCPRCFKLYGVGLGTGRGQKYDSKTLEKVEG